MLTAGATVAGVDRRFLRPGWLVGHLLVLAAFAVCCRLGVWQWDRTHDADGTLQNLSYAILWPLFGIAFIYMWVRFLLLEKAKDAADDQQLDEGIAAILDDADGAQVTGDDGAAASGTAAVIDAADAAEPPGQGDDTPGADAEDAADEDADPAPPESADTFVGTIEEIDEDEDPEMAAYNRALAALAERDERRGR